MIAWPTTVTSSSTSVITCQRSKDQVLQENGYFVLRFLAEDVGRELDLVLDAILRALSHHRSAVLTTAPLA